jgi:hypothetical protein
MRRASLERPRTLRVWRAHHRLVHADEVEITCICEEQPGRFRKTQRVAGCLIPHCYLCKWDKINEIVPASDYRAAISHREWGEEYGFPVRMPRID